MFEQMSEKIASFGVIPVVVLNDADNAVPLAKALMDAGLGVAEVTFRTAAAEESIRRMAEAYPEMIIGAGTVLTTEQAERKGVFWGFRRVLPRPRRFPPLPMDKAPPLCYNFARDSSFRVLRPTDNRTTPERARRRFA